MRQLRLTTATKYKYKEPKVTRNFKSKSKLTGLRQNPEEGSNVLPERVAKEEKGRRMLSVLMNSHTQDSPYMTQVPLPGLLS